MSEQAPSERVRVRQAPQRAAYDRETVYSILDEGLVAHVGFVDGDRPFVLPMSFGRDGDRLVLHGGKNARLMHKLADGAEVCVTVTLLDGLVVATRTMHHSMNFRSVVVFGRGRAITDRSEKRTALMALVEHVLPGHSTYALPIEDKEVDATAVMEIALDEASAKIRGGAPSDPKPGEDNDGIWSGVIPLRLTPLVPVAENRAQDIEAPESVQSWRRPNTRA